MVETQDISQFTYADILIGLEMCRAWLCTTKNNTAYMGNSDIYLIKNIATNTIYLKNTSLGTYASLNVAGELVDVVP